MREHQREVNAGRGGRRRVPKIGAAVATALVLLVGAGASPAGATQLENARVTSFLAPGTGQGGGIFNEATGLMTATQTKRTAKNGSRPMGIIAILIGLKADQDYALSFSTRPCSAGGGGLVGRKVKFTSSQRGDAVVKRRYRLTRKALRRSKSVVLLSPESGRRFVSCGRLSAYLKIERIDGE